MAFSFFKKKIITDLFGQNDYLTRWSIYIPFLRWSIKLHKISRPDDDRCSHDHPWWFFRVILYGGYEEIYGPDNKRALRKPWRPWAPWRIYFCSKNFRHRIIKLTKDTNWTLCLMGKGSNKWGFFTNKGWMHHEKFVSSVTTSRVLWCAEGDDGQTLQKEPEQK